MIIQLDEEEQSLSFPPQLLLHPKPPKKLFPPHPPKRKIRMIIHKILLFPQVPQFIFYASERFLHKRLYVSTLSNITCFI